MNISILTLFPELYKPFLTTSLIGRAQEKGVVRFDLQDLFLYTDPKERIDAPTYGPTPGMLIKPEVIQAGIEDKEKQYGPAFKIFFSPQGKKLNQTLLKSLFDAISERGHGMVIPARYEGMDARVEQQYAEAVISVGDFVLMGGDIPAMMLLEGLLRLVPGVVGRQESVAHESFSGPFVDYPEYTAPIIWQGLEVPAIVRSGNHEAIRVWREQEAVRKTVFHHFGWLQKSTPTLEQKKLVQAFMPAHYTVLMHDQVLIGPQERKPGTTSVTSVDIHDIARSSATYGIKNFFIVTPLEDQKKIVSTLLNFWQHGPGIEYNVVRHEAVSSVQVHDDLDSVVNAIEQLSQKKPVLVATSARPTPHANHVSFYDQEKVWASGRPVLLVFGTGQGLTPELIERCDFILPPVEGFSSFNHLSVRSAVAIVLDRWLGIKSA